MAGYEPQNDDLPELFGALTEALNETRTKIFWRYVHAAGTGQPLARAIFHAVPLVPCD